LILDKTAYFSYYGLLRLAKWSVTIH